MSYKKVDMSNHIWGRGGLYCIESRSKKYRLDFVLIMLSPFQLDVIIDLINHQFRLKVIKLLVRESN